MLALLRQGYAIQASFECSRLKELISRAQDQLVSDNIISRLEELDDKVNHPLWTELFRIIG
jgi:hypothetical protein